MFHSKVKVQNQNKSERQKITLKNKIRKIHT